MRPPAIARRLPRAPDRFTVVAGAVAAAGTLVTLAAALKFGFGALLLPIAAMAFVLLLRYPGPVLACAVGAVVFAETSEFAILPQTGHLYDDLVKGFMPLDGLLVIAVAGTAAQLIQDRRPVRLPPAPLTLALGLMALGLISGILVGREAGVGVGDSLLQVHTFAYLAIAPLVAANLVVTARDVKRVLAGAVVLGAIKALIGLFLVVSGRGVTVYDASVLTYYEPTANWIMTVAVLAIVAAALARVRLPWWALTAAPLMLASLLLSYRRSFWIADLLGLALVVLLGTSNNGRRVLLPAVVLVAAAIWSLGGIAVQSDTPLGQRVQSLSSSKIQAKPEDRYRLDERANVVATLKQDPVTGLGFGVGWRATERPLPVEVNPDHEYVHFALLYWWLKLGILGLLAYLAFLGAGVVLSFGVWRGGTDPLFRAFGLGSMCSFAGLAVIETTATFTGPDPRMTLVLGAQLALLAVLWRSRVRRGDQAASSDVIAVV
ncbi:MAG TPA: O-antigen ligase family protein [Baekduia sp.]|nr:O-antigen ligase family protein [Baekduia sp.]